MLEFNCIWQHLRAVFFHFRLQSHSDRAELAEGGLGGVKGEGGAKLTLGDSVVNDNNGNITIKSNSSSESKVSAVNDLNWLYK